MLEPLAKVFSRLQVELQASRPESVLQTALSVTSEKATGWLGLSTFVEQIRAVLAGSSAKVQTSVNALHVLHTIAPAFCLWLHCTSVKSSGVT